ncbi:hypothetical protein D3C75_1280120 [compost metagenome]
MLAVLGHGADYIVIKRPLHHIRIPGFRRNLQHPLGKENQANRSAGLRINRIVGQIIIKSKCFAVMRGADPAGNVHLFVRHIIP